MAPPQGTPESAFQDARELRRALNDDLQRVSVPGASRPCLIVLSGLPGTGKSHFARELSRRVPLVIIGSDHSRKTLVSRPQYTPEEHARVFAACHLLVEELLSEGYRVVFDATNLTERFRLPLYEIAGRADAGLLMVWFTASREVVRRRLDDRAAGRSEDSYSDADWQVYCRLRPGQEAIDHPHLVVDSGLNIQPVLAEVVRIISN